MSCLQALDHLKIDHLIIEEIISKLTSLKASGFVIHLCWLLGHVGIHGNERADRAAKMAHRTDMQPCLNPTLGFQTHHSQTYHRHVAEHFGWVTTKQTSQNRTHH